MGPRQSLRALPLPRAAAVVRVGGVVDDGADVDAGGLDGADGLLTTGPGATDDDVDLRHAHVLRLAGGVGGGELRGVGRALLGALVADRAGRRPGHGVAVHVRDRDDRVVVGGVDERLALGERALDAPLRALVGWCLGHSSDPLLPRGLLLAGHGAARALAGARVGLGGLSAHGQAAAVAQAAVAADVHEALDVQLHLAAQVALDLVVAVHDLAQAGDLGLGEVLDPRGGVDLGLGEDLLGTGPADAVDVRQRGHDALLARQVDT